MKHFIAITSLALALIAFGTAVHAQDTDDPPSVRVSYADLDLSSQSGRATLNSRVSRAVDMVCGERPSLSDLWQTAVYDHCRSTARSGANRQLSELYRRVDLADQTLREMAAR
jgi:UrcA family protein